MRAGSTAPMPPPTRARSRTWPTCATASRRARARAGSRSQLDPLTALARSIRRALRPQPDLPVLDAYLVDRGRAGEFVALVHELGGYLDGVELVCTGPCPPYSFADAGAYPGGVLRSTS